MFEDPGEDPGTSEDSAKLVPTAVNAICAELSCSRGSFVTRLDAREAAGDLIPNACLSLEVVYLLRAAERQRTTKTREIR
jgi:hypothetical protein